MIKLMKGVVVAACLMAMVAVAGADDLKAQVQKAHDTVSKLALKNDSAALSKAMAGFVTKDFVWKEQGQTMNLTQWQGMLQQQMKAIKITGWKFTSKNLKQAGNSATGTAVLDMSATMKNPQTGKTSVLKSLSTAKETYVKVGGAWKLKSLEILSDKSTIDGKPAG